MGALDAARCGAVMAAVAMAIATAGCAELFGVEPPPALSNAGASTLYAGAARPPSTAAWAPAQDVREVREVRGPAVVVLQVPAGSLVSVTVAPAEAPAPVPRGFRPSPYEDEPIPTPPGYKPSPYEDPGRPALYRTD